jgi:hypothetical protein
VKLGDRSGALKTLEEVLTSGFDEYETMRKDSTLTLLGKDLDVVIERFKPKNPFLSLFAKK